MVKVSVAWPVPMVTAAEPAEGVFEVMTLVVPGPPLVALSVIPVTGLTRLDVGGHREANDHAGRRSSLRTSPPGC